jgi:hypothetical protein
MEEIWKAIPGYQGLYEVSNYGNVRSIRYGKERLLKLINNGNGYFKVNLSKDNKMKHCQIHKLVAMAFLGHHPDGHKEIINHKDRNPSNNNLNNLEIVDTRYNSTEWRNDVGITWDKSKNRWRSRIIIEGKSTYLGLFKDKQDGLDAYQKALNEYKCK